MKLSVHLLSPGHLTDKESSVLFWLCHGLSRKEIAQKMTRSLGTISKHVEHIAEKLDAHSHAEIVAKAVAAKLVNITLKMLLIVFMFNAGGYRVEQSLRRPPSTPKPPATRSMSRQQTSREQR